MNAREIKVYKTKRTLDLYLYVDAADDLSRVPGPLLERFGRPIEALSLTLTPGRTLARVDAVTVLDQIEQRGFYLQLPPDPNAWRNQ